MIILNNYQIQSDFDKPILVDLFYEQTGTQKPLVIFVHGYKGYKNWGIFDKMNQYFVDGGFALLKFNFSHNGGTPEQPIDFPDLEAFGTNNYTKELSDVQTVINWISNNTDHHHEIDVNQIYLIGHSRGGGISTLTAAADSRIKKIVTWASVSTLDRSFFHEGPELTKWKETGVTYIINGRTKQNMPHYIQFYEDYIQNQAKLNIKSAAKKINVPHLIIHGNGDVAVPFFHAENLHSWNSNSKLVNILNANHVFGGKQPWTEEKLPDDFLNVLNETLDFLLRVSP